MKMNSKDIKKTNKLPMKFSTTKVSLFWINFICILLIFWTQNKANTKQFAFAITVLTKFWTMFKYHSCLEILFIQLTCQAHIKKVYEKKKTGLVYWKPICNSDGTYSTTEKIVSFNRIL